MGGLEELSNWRALSIAFRQGIRCRFCRLGRQAGDFQYNHSQPTRKKNLSHRLVIVYNTIPTVIGKFGPHRIRRPASRLLHI